MPASFRPPVRVAIVTLDNHLKGAVERADAELSAENIHLSLHAASDWDGDAGALERTKSAIGEAHIVIATMLFLDDHIRTILPTLEARREQCDAMVGLMSAGEVVRLTRLGGYRMDAPARGPLALLKKLRGSGKPGTNSGAGQMKMLRRLPKILRFIPGTAQDVRAYFLTLQYWLAGSEANVVAMTRALVDRYAAGDRLTRRGMTPAAASRRRCQPISGRPPARSSRVSVTRSTVAPVQQAQPLMPMPDLSRVGIISSNILSLSLTDAMSRQPDTFPRVYVAMVEAGEAHARRPGVVQCPLGRAYAGVLVGPGTAWSEVRDEGFAIAMPPVGVMIEVPDVLNVGVDAFDEGVFETLLGWLGAPGVDDLGRERERDLPPDAPARACDDGDLACEEIGAKH